MLCVATFGVELFESVSRMVVLLYRFFRIPPRCRRSSLPKTSGTLWTCGKFCAELRCSLSSIWTLLQLAKGCQETRRSKDTSGKCWCSIVTNGKLIVSLCRHTSSSISNQRRSPPKNFLLGSSGRLRPIRSTLVVDNHMSYLSSKLLPLAQSCLLSVDTRAFIASL